MFFISLFVIDKLDLFTYVDFSSFFQNYANWYAILPSCHLATISQNFFFRCDFIHANWPFSEQRQCQRGPQSVRSLTSPMQSIKNPQTAAADHHRACWLDGTHVLPLGFSVPGCGEAPLSVFPLPLPCRASVQPPLVGCCPTWRFTCRAHQRDVTEGLAPGLDERGEISSCGIHRQTDSKLLSSEQSKKTWKPEEQHGRRRLLNTSMPTCASPPPPPTPSHFYDTY